MTKAEQALDSEERAGKKSPGGEGDRQTDRQTERGGLRTEKEWLPSEHMYSTVGGIPFDPVSANKKKKSPSPPDASWKSCVKGGQGQGLSPLQPSAAQYFPRSASSIAKILTFQTKKLEECEVMSICLHTYVSLCLV